MFYFACHIISNISSHALLAGSRIGSLAICFSSFEHFFHIKQNLRLNVERSLKTEQSIHGRFLPRRFTFRNQEFLMLSLHAVRSHRIEFIFSRNRFNAGGFAFLGLLLFISFFF